MNTPAEVLPVEAAHAALLAAMHRICFAEPWDEAAMAALMAMPGSYGYLAGAPNRAEAGKPQAVGPSDVLEPQGFVLCRVAADEAEVLTLLVLPGYRRHRLATTLLEKALEKAWGDGAMQMFLEVAANNEGGLALYKTLGFEEVGRRPGYYGGCIDALVLRKGR